MAAASVRGASVADPSPWSSSPEALLLAHRVDPTVGLDPMRVGDLRKRYGPNRLRGVEQRLAWHILLAQFANLMTALLAAAIAVSFAQADWGDGIAISVVIALNVAIGFLTELRAVRSMEALYKLGQVSARVRREGRTWQVSAAELVPGDIVLVDAGDVITADLRVISASKLQADESALTGESLPVAKSTAPVPLVAPLAERTSMLYKGTAITRGAGEGVVVATGLATELGAITKLVAETDSGETPLEHRLQRLGRSLVWITLGLAVVLSVLGVLTGRELGATIETAIALAIATVPEGLPIVATIALARGMWRMARQSALVNRLSAVETLGATAVICTDKTGTLTENRMTVVHLALPSCEYTVHADGSTPAFDPVSTPAGDGDASLREALEIGALCNDAELHGSRLEDAIGNPMEAALLLAASKLGIDRAALVARRREVRQVAFDADSKLMATFHRDDDGHRVAIKGAPEAVIAACTHERGSAGDHTLGEAERQSWLDRNAALAGQGLRVLALATKRVERVDDAPYRDLVFVGLVGLADPPRAGVREAIARCQTAGIRVVMVTGDQAVTARSVARAVGLVRDGSDEAVPGDALRPLAQLSTAERRRLADASIFSRVSPKQKLHLIALHQADGATVAMTGDGVNDAPALKRADIGIAMGARGTQVAREAADMVLKDDAFPTIVVGIEQGRVIFDNIRKFVVYLLSCNVSELAIVAIAMLTNAPMPLLPLQILFLNIVTDVFPALALGVGAGDPDIMERPPRPANEAILTRRHWAAIAAYGSLITLAVLGATVVARLGLGRSLEASITISFLTLAFAQLWHVFNMREPRSGFVRNGVTRNGYVWGAIALCSGLLLGAIYTPRLAALLHLVRPSAIGWGIIVAFSVLPWLVGQIYLAVKRDAAVEISVPLPRGQGIGEGRA